MSNCYCNACLLPMSSDRPTRNSNYCCDDCRQMARMEPEKPMKHFDKYYRKAKEPVGLRMYRRSEDRPARPSCNSVCRLRVRGIKRQRLTTKKERV